MTIKIFNRGSDTASFLGLLLKGCDLFLNAFAEGRQHLLTACASVSHDKSFEQAFYKELYKTSNIQSFGWVNATSPNLKEIITNRLGLVYPSVYKNRPVCTNKLIASK